MMKLSEVPFDQIKGGLLVSSDTTGTRGQVVRAFKDDQYKDWDVDGWYVEVIWESGRKSTHNHWAYDKVTVI